MMMIKNGLELQEEEDVKKNCSKEWIRISGRRI
jgi:hypothetical protein